MNIKRKIATAIVTGSMIGAMLLPTAALADTSGAEISGNGAGSSNLIKIINNCDIDVSQSNRTYVNTNIDVNQNTGQNEASSNTGGSVTIESGDATSNVTVSVGGSSNEISELPSCCECVDPIDATITGNGEGSSNKIVEKNKKNVTVKQKNKTKVKTKVKIKQKTGKNKANSNTGGDVDVTSGNAEATASVVVDPSSNSL